MKIKTFFLLNFIIPIFASSFAYGGNVQTTVENNNSFGVDLYQELKSKPGNLFFSPYSISSALAMTYAGAKGNTEKEMADVLHFTLEQTEDLHASFLQLETDMKFIEEKGDIKLSLANSLWIQQDYKLLESFVELNQKYYNAGLNSVDFKNNPEDVRLKINSWVEDKTQQKIQNLLNPGDLTPLTRLVLCNAIYFKGKWSSKFNKDNTQDRDFHLSETETIQVSTMYQKAKFKIKNFDNFSALELPYRGQDVSMFIFLPNEIDGLANLEEEIIKIGPTNIITDVLQQPTEDVKVFLPKFKTSLRIDLKSELSNMGMPTPFNGNLADFTGMYPVRDLYIGKVIHKAFIEIDEEGTEAAAATAVVMRTKSIGFATTYFTVDCPFVFCIRENKNGSILFMGRITDPRK
jgi:serpin B